MGDGGYNLFDKLSDMPKLKPIYCPSRNVRGFEMTFPNAPQFLALFEKENFRQAESVSLWGLAKDMLRDRKLSVFSDQQLSVDSDQQQPIARSAHYMYVRDRKTRISSIVSPGPA